jgi:serine/threonine-protein kinase
MSFINELKRRSVFKVTFAYGLVAWLVAQLAEFAISTFGAPDWVLRTFVVLLLLGFPIAIILAWAFDMTPSGLKKASIDNLPASEVRGPDYLVILLLGVVLAAAVILQFWGPDIQAPRATKPVMQSVGSSSLFVDIALPEDTPLAFVGAAALGNGRRAFALSPDGQHLVYAGKNEGKYALYLRDLDSHEVHQLGGTEDGYDPFFSPNGQWIAFFAGNQLKRVARAGGDAVAVTQATNSAGGTWIGNDRILALTNEGDDLLTFSFGGERQELPAPRSGGAPHALPDGSHVLWSSGQIVVFDITSQELRPLTVRGKDPRYLGGFLFYSQGDTLVAARFDIESLTLQSAPVPVLTGLRTEVYGFSQWALSNNGTLLYAPGISAAENPLIWADRNRQESLGLPQHEKGSFEISPDGKQLVVAEIQSGTTDLWLYDLENATSRKISSESGIWSRPLVWMPDGKEIIYHRQTERGGAPFVMSLDSGNPGKPLLRPFDGDLLVNAISADARLLSIRRIPSPDEFAAAKSTTAEPQADQLGLIDVVEDREIEIPTVGTGDWGISVSPKGDAVVYTSSVSGEYQNYLQPVPPTGVRYQISRAGGAEEPRWSRDGSKIYYRSSQRIMVVDVQIHPKIVISEPRVFYEGSFVNVGGRSYDISPDGSRALVIAGPDDSARSIRLITNWLDQVERMVSASDGP